MSRYMYIYTLQIHVIVIDIEQVNMTNYNVIHITSVTIQNINKQRDTPRRNY